MTDKEMEMYEQPEIQEFVSEYEENTGFKIDDDLKADWAVRKLMCEKNEIERLRNIAKLSIEAVQSQLEAAEKRYENKTSYLTSKLAEYFETVPHKESKTQHSYRLLSGSLVKKIGGKSMKQNEEKLLEYLKASGNADMVSVTEKPRWGDFKKTLEIVGGSVVCRDTGEIVEGVEIVENPDTFSIKF